MRWAHVVHTSSDKLFHLLEWAVNRLEHSPETILVRSSLVDDVLVDLPALSVAHAYGVDHVVIGVLQGGNNI